MLLLHRHLSPLTTFRVAECTIMISEVLASPMIPPCQGLLGEGWRTPPPPLEVAAKIKFIERQSQFEIFIDFRLRLRPEEFYFRCDS